jgi:hypothetical protein
MRPDRSPPGYLPKYCTSYSCKSLAPVPPKWLSCLGKRHRASEVKASQRLIVSDLDRHAGQRKAMRLPDTPLTRSEEVYSTESSLNDQEVPGGKALQFVQEDDAGR